MNAGEKNQSYVFKSEKFFNEKRKYPRWYKFRWRVPALPENRTAYSNVYARKKRFAR